MQKICFIMAMQAEAKPLIDRYGLQNIEGFFGEVPTELYQGIISGKELSIVTLGRQHGVDLVGCEAATLATTLAINTLHPDMIINAGTCGAFKANGSEIGDVYLSQGPVMFHDRRIGDDPLGIQSLGNYPTFDARQIAADLKLKLGKCTTGSSLDCLEEDLAIIQREGGMLKDMEAGAVAFVASVYKTPLICVKSVTDLIDGGEKTIDEFRKNLTMASNALRDACTKIIQYLFVDQPTLF